ncbi:hypothetical protein D9M72_460090 [compost metagenome]
MHSKKFQAKEAEGLKRLNPWNGFASIAAVEAVETFVVCRLLAEDDFPKESPDMLANTKANKNRFLNIIIKFKIGRKSFYKGYYTCRVYRFNIPNLILIIF